VYCAVQGPGKMVLGSWKVLEIFLTKTVGTLACWRCAWSCI